MKPYTKPVRKLGPAAIREEIADLRAELDDFIHRVPMLSQVELNQAKEKLIQKLATTNRAAGPLIADVHKKINPNIIHHSIIIGTLAALALATYTRAARESHPLSGHSRRCSQLTEKGESECNKHPRCVWCPEDLTGSGGGTPAHCYNPCSKEECIGCPSCEWKPDFCVDSSYR